MVADIFTKGLPRIKHYKCMEAMNLKMWHEFKGGC
jgi:hypothetical protein